MDLGFPALDPTPAQEQQVLARVLGTGRRRRMRRRVVAAAPMALVAALAIAALWPNEHGSDSRVSSGPDSNTLETPPSVPPEVPSVTWDEATLAPDGRTLSISIGAAPPGPGPCNENYNYELVEGPDTVVIEFRQLPHEPATTEAPDAPCIIGRAQPQVFDIALAQPLADREVRDGLRPEPRPIRRLDELVTLTYTPEGFVPAAPTYDTEGRQPGWERPYRSRQSDWYFVIEQHRTPPPATGTPTSIELNGAVAERYTDQDMGGESIRFQLDGTTITVRAVPTFGGEFTHSDEVLAIAQGIRPPS